MLETWVHAELLKSYWHHGRRAPFYDYLPLTPTAQAVPVWAL